MMPFLSEELYQKLPTFNGKSESLCISKYPEFREDWVNNSVENKLEQLLNIISSVRSMTVQVNLGLSIRPEMYFVLLQNDDELKNLIIG